MTRFKTEVRFQNDEHCLNINFRMTKILTNKLQNDQDRTTNFRMTRINKKIQNDEDCYKQTSSDYCNRMTKIVTNKIQNEEDRDQQTSEWPGLEFTLWFFKRIARFLWAKERFALSKEWIAHRCSFVNSDECVALLKRETERREQLLILGHKKGKSSEKHTKNKNFYKQIACFLRVICSNHDGITHVALFFCKVAF